MQKHDRFGHGGVVTCLVCGKKTRETGAGEGQYQMCAACIDENERQNAEADK